MMTLTHPVEDQTVRNRAFNCRMRNRRYEEVFYAFCALSPLMTQTNVSDRREWFAAIGEKIAVCETTLEACLEYAQASVFFGKLEKIGHYSSENPRGILQEELLLVYFLSELQATTRYLLSRIEMDKELQNMDSEMEANKNGAYVFGFISNMHKNLNALNLATEKEFRDLHSHIKTRFEIGNELFGVLQEVQHFY